MRVLVIPDIHLKPWIFDAAEAVIKHERPDAVVELGDLVDDFGCKNNREAYIATVNRAIEFSRRHPDAHWILGNHEASYLWNQWTNGMAYRAKDEASRQCQRLVYELPEGKYTIALMVDNVLFTHGGVGAGFVAAHVPHGTSDADVVRAINDMGADELWCYSSPLWYRPSFIADLDELYGEGRLLQVCGHTPVEHITQCKNIVVCDTFSTYRDHRPYGDRTFCIVDTTAQTWKPVPAPAQFIPPIKS